jgi:uncharacterized membrane protein SirB2
VNELIYNIAVWIDTFETSTKLHESYYMYNWIESTHVLSLMISLGMLFLIDLRMLGFAFADVPASKIADRLNTPMLIGFGVAIITGILLFYAVPIRSSQSIWFRAKMLIMLGAGINAWLFHKRMKESVGTWDSSPVAPNRIRVGAAISLGAWGLIVLFGRLIAYDWFDCQYPNSDAMRLWAGCIDGQTLF